MPSDSYSDQTSTQTDHAESKVGPNLGLGGASDPMKVARQAIRSQVTARDYAERQLAYRSSKVVGSNVVNDADETIGKIDDLLVSSDGKRPYAVLSIGGFLGMGTHMVVVPYDTLKFADKKVTLPGGTKEGLRMLPEFKYAIE